MKSHFIQAIRNLKDMLANQAARVEHTVHLAVEAVINHLLDVAEQIISQDCEIDQAEVAIEEECLKILALYHPLPATCAKSSPSSKSTRNRTHHDMAVNIAERVRGMAEVAEGQVDT